LIPGLNIIIKNHGIISEILQHTWKNEKFTQKFYWKGSGKVKVWNDLRVDKKIILKCIFQINIVVMDLIRVAQGRNSRSFTGEQGNTFLIERKIEGIF